jgi:redox-sensing transcriptional repressor
VSPSPIPSETADRLFSYLRPLMCLRNERTETVVSRDLARLCHVKPAVVRKDLSYLGSVGTRGVGYRVGDLIESIRRILRFDDDVRVAVIGVGNIGKALLEQSRFEFEGFRIVTAFDSNPEVVGRRVGKVVVEDVADLEDRIRSESIQLAILAVPESSAPAVAKRLGGMGIRCILSFAPCELAMPDDVKVTCVDLSVMMARLVYHSYVRDRCDEESRSTA